MDIIDLRSDTVTRPTPAMRRAMAEAEVGDDVFGEDPTVRRLEEEAAVAMAKEAAVFVPSGTMGNQIALHLHARSGEEILVEASSHVLHYEMGALAALSGAQVKPIPAKHGLLDPAVVEAAIVRDVPYQSRSAALVVENTHNLAGGTTYTADQTRGCIEACREAKLKVHIDGARLWNAAVALGVEPRALAAGADTLMVTLSKGLCAPAGSLLLASKALVDKARRVRKQLGGGMRQVGVLAAAGIVALETMIPRLAEDHANARLLADALGKCRGATLQPPATNIVVATLEGRAAPDVVDALKAKGVLATAMDARTLRLTTHRDVSRADCERAAGLLAEVVR